MTKKHALSISAGVFSVVVAYAFFAGLWILLSDQAMWLLFSDQATLERVSMAKGWTFVAITTLLLYFLVRRLVGQLVAAHQRELAFEREREQPPPMLVAIANASSDAIFAKDDQGRYLLVNNVAARYMGKPADDLDAEAKAAIKAARPYRSIDQYGVARLLFPINTGAPEIMEGVGGSCRVKLKGESEWTTYGDGQSFNVPGNSSFEIACDEPYHYVCHFG